MHLLPFLFYISYHIFISYIFLLYLFIALSSIINVWPVRLFLRKPDLRLSVRLKALRSALRIVRKCFWSFLKIKRFDQAPIRYL